MQQNLIISGVRTNEVLGLTSGAGAGMQRWPKNILASEEQKYLFLFGPILHTKYDNIIKNTQYYEIHSILVGHTTPVITRKTPFLWTNVACVPNLSIVTVESSHGPI
jgi:hypothetical protein